MIAEARLWAKLSSTKLFIRLDIHSPDACQRTNTSDYTDLVLQFPRTNCTIELGLDLIKARSRRDEMLLRALRLLQFGVGHILNRRRMEERFGIESGLQYLKRQSGEEPVHSDAGRLK